MIQIVEQAAERAGGLMALASALGIRHQTFYSWKRVPAERVLELERITGISRHELRPDLAAIFVPLPADDPEDAELA
ncbi:MAG TPA: YdaS family helix-turn-helix protein [Devosiaceae bacterium]|jgi:DNA-binding transcriptional regulator YdaS (Cro superfamily)